MTDRATNQGIALALIKQDRSNNGCIGAIFKDKASDLIGAVYLELCMIQGYNVGFNAGQSMIMENVSGMCDRVVSFRPSSVIADVKVPRITIDKVIGFVNDGGNSTNIPIDGTNLNDLP